MGKTKHGMISGYSGLDPLLELQLLPYTISSFSEQEHSKPLDHRGAMLNFATILTQIHGGNCVYQEFVGRVLSSLCGLAIGLALCFKCAKSMLSFSLIFCWLCTFFVVAIMLLLP
nr:hypothetical protein Itr_chr01CG02630 [Ipomoea trifida]